MDERRRHRRVTLRTPVRASVGATPVFVVDASRGGLRVAHQSELPPPGGICRIDVTSEMGPIRLDCTIVHTAIRQANAAAKSLFNSGLEILAADRQSTERMRALLGKSGNNKKPPSS